MNNISVTPKGGTIASLTNGSEVTLTTPSLVKLNLNQSDIKSYTRNGNDLVITTKSGEHLVIHNFYGPNGESDLVLQDDNGALWWVENPGGDGFQYVSIDSTDGLLAANTTHDNAIAAFGMGGALLAGLGAMFAGTTGSGGSEGGSNNAGGGDNGGGGTNPGGGGTNPGGGGTNPGGGGDTTAPGTASNLVLTDNAGAIQGAITSGTNTDDNTPTLSGTAEAGSIVSIYDGSTLLGTVVVGADGSWSFTTPTLADGSHSITTTVTDAAGNTSAASDPINFVVDTVAPVAASALVVTDDVGGSQGPLTSGATTDDNTPTLSGQAEANSIIKIYDGQTLLGSAVADANGSWSFTTPALSNGSHSLTVTVTDAAGNVSPATPAFDVNIAAGFPPATTSLQVTDDSGNTLVQLLDGSSTRDTTPVLTGLATANALITLYDGNTLLGSVVAGTDGQWVFTPGTLADGTHTFHATITDPNGNVTDSNTIHIIIDTVAPEAAGDLQLGNNEGSTVIPIPAGGSTNDTTPVLTGTAEPGSTVTISDGTTVLGTAVVGSDGNWSFTTPALGEGQHSLTTTVSDPAGNTSPASDPINFIVDTTPPAAASGLTVTDNVGDSQGPITSGVSTDDNTPTLSGQAEPNSVISVYDGTTLLGQTTTDVNGNWSFTTPALTNGSHSLTVTVTDSAGNVSPATPAFDAVVAADLPPATSSLQVTDDSGNTLVQLANGANTQDSTPVLSGLAGANTLITLYDGTTLLGSVVAGSNGQWSFTPTTLDDGPHSFHATITDVNSNVTDSITINIVIDTQAPAAAGDLQLGDNNGSAVVPIAAGGATNDSSPQLSGTAEPGSTVTISDGNTVLGTATVGSDGSWSFTTPVLSDGNHSLTTTVSDAAGNTSPASDPISFTVDTVPPAAASGLTVTDDVGDSQGPLTSGGFSDDSTPTLSGQAEANTVVSVYDGDTLLGTVTVGSDGNWSFTPDALTNGNHSLTVTVTDAAGNVSPTTTPFNVTINADLPAATSSLQVTDDSGNTLVQLADGDFTHDSTPVLSGLAGAGNLITLYDGTTVLGSVTADSNGQWVFTPGTLVDGSHAFQATITDINGNITNSDTITITIDTVATGAAGGLQLSNDESGTPVPIEPGSATNDNTPVLSGSAEPGSIVTIQDGDNLLGTATVDNDGNWSFTLPTLTEGEHSLTTTVTDQAGNTSEATDPFVFTVDTTPPAVADNLQLSNDTSGTAVPITSGATNDTTPVLSGTAEPGSTVTISDGDTVLGTAITDSDGNWSYTTPALDEGDHSLTTTVTDTAGNTGLASSPIAVTVDTTAPEAASGLQLSNDLSGTPVPVADGGVTNDTTPVLTGTAEPGSTVTISDGDTVLGTATVGSNGNWSFTPDPLGEGDHSLTATVTDAAGNTGPASDPVTVTIDTTAPAIAGDVQLSNNNGGTPVPVAAGGATNDTTPVLSGTADPGSIITVSDGNDVLGTTTVDNDGNWSFITPALGEGDHSLTATVTDPAGNTSPPSAAIDFTVDTTAPDVATGLQLSSDVTGTSVPVTAGTTNDTTPILSGTAEPGSTVTVSDGTNVLGTATVDGNGNWSFTTPALDEGDHSLTATVTDPAGNTSDASDPLAITIDTTAPDPVDGVQLSNDSSGTSVPVAAGGATNDTTPVLSGTADPGSTVTVSDGDTVLGTTTVDGDGNWSFTTPVLAEGDHSLTATVTDPAGNTSTASDPLAFSVDTQPPVAASGLQLSNDSGGTSVPIAAGSSTSDTTPVLSGTAEPGSTVTVSDGTNVLGTATVDGDGNWSFTTPALDEGDHSLTAIVTDPAGNASPASDPIAVTIDTTAPAAADNLQLSSDTSGTLVPITTGATNDTTPILSGTAEPGSTVTVSDGANVLGTATVDGDGNWSFTSPALDEGDHSLTTTVTDAAGNTGDASDPILVTVDTTAPDPVTNLTAENDNGDTLNGLTGDSTPTLSGTAEAGSIITIYDNMAVIGSVQADATTGSWNFTPQTLTDGDHNLMVTETDLAGNVSAPSNMVALTVDTTAPDAADFVLNNNNGSTDVPITNGGLTNDNSPELSGTAEANSLITIYDGTDVIGSVTTDGSGNWSFITTPLLDGSHALSITVTDAAGNIGPSSSVVNFDIDTAAPDAVTDLVVNNNEGSTLVPITEGNLTNDATPELTGTAEAGSIVNVYDGTTLLGSTSVGADGTWSYIIPELDQGAHSLSVTVSDAAGNTSANSDTIDFTVDSEAPDPADNLQLTNDATDTPIAAGGATNDSTPVLSGTAEANSIVTVSDGSNVLGTALTDIDGNWTFTTPTLTDGDHSLTVTVTDTAGNVSTASDPLAVTIDTQPPVAASNLQLSSDASGSLVPITSGATNDTTPVLSGTAEPGSTVTVAEGSNVLGTATVDGDGNWSFTSPVLSEGAHSLTTTVTDAAGNTGPASPAVAITIDTAAPDPVADLVVNNNEGSTLVPIADGGFTNDPTPELTGSSDVGNIINVYDGTTLLGSTVVGTDGTWTFTTGALDQGEHNLSVTVTDPAGNTSANSAVIGFTIDSEAPDAADNLLLTNDQTDTEIAAGGATNDNTPVLSGTAEANSIVTVSDGSNVLGTALVDADGNWSFTTPTLTDGEHSLTVTVTDSAGNVSDVSDPLTVTVDTVVPTIAELTLSNDIGGGSVAIPDGGLTNDNTPVLSGSGEEGDIITISDENGVLGSLVVDNTGTWSYTTSVLADGSHTLSVTATDAAGNVSAPATISVQVDATAPDVATGITLSNDNGTTAVGIPNNGTTNDSTPLLSGSAEAGSVVTISDGSTVIGSAIVDNNGQWSFSVPTLTGTSHSLSVTVTDAAGNTSDASTPINFTLDTSAPIATSIVVSNDDGTTPVPLADGDTTNDNTPLLTGTAEENSIITIYDGSVVIGSTTADTDGNWSFSTPTLIDGSHTLSATVTDVNGNVSTASTTFTVAVDATAPEPVGDLVLQNNDSTPSVVIPDGGATNDNTPELVGTAEPDSIISVYDGTTLLGTTTTDGDGNWNYTTPTLSNATHTLNVTVTDEAGNVSSTTSVTVTVNTVTPDPVTNFAIYDNDGTTPFVVANGGSTNDETPVLRGNATAGTTVNIYQDDVLIGSTTVGDNGVWRFETSALTDGPYTFNVSVTDAAGNTSALSADYTVTIDTVAPDAINDFVVTDDAGGQTGELASGDTTDDSTPTLSGSATTGDVISIYDGNTLLGTVTATAGAWSFTPAALSNGSHSFTVTVTDPAGNVSAASSPAFDVTINAGMPPATSTLEITDDSGSTLVSLSDGADTKDSTPVLSGLAAEDDVITIHDGATVLGSVLVDASGQWTFTPSPALADGDHALFITTVDGLGNPGATSSTINITVDTTAPDAVDDLVVSKDTGGTVVEIADGSSTNDSTPLLTGTSEANAVITIYDGANVVGSTTANASGVWSYNTPTLSNGSHTLSVTATDAAGNTSANSAAVTFTVDTHAPDVATLVVTNDTTNTVIANGASTNDSTPTLSGTAEANSTITIYDGSTVLGTAITTAGGTWSFTTATLPEGSHVFTVRATDAAGNVSVASSSATVVIDVTAPAAVTLAASNNNGTTVVPIANNGTTNDNTPALSGTAEAGAKVSIYDGATLLGTVTAGSNGAWSFTTSTLADGPHTLNVTATDAAGNVSPNASVTLTVDTAAPAASTLTITADNVTPNVTVPSGGSTNDNTPTLSGTAEAGSVVTISDGSTVLGSVTVGTGGTWSFTTSALSNGTHPLSVTVKDTAGNVSGTTSATITVDTVAPAASTLVITNDATNTVVPSGGSTNDSTPVLSGTAEVGSKVTIYDGSTVLGTLTVGAGGTWSFTTATLSNGTHPLSVTVTDAAGNVSGTTSASVIIDTVAPAAVTGLAASNNNGSTPVAIANNGTTNDNTPALSGTAEAGAKVSIYDGATLLGTVTAGSNGAWSFTTSTLADGPHTLNVTATDAAGNVSPNASVTLTVDTAAPAASTLTITADNVTPNVTVPSGGSTNDNTPTLSGTAEAGSVVTISDGSTVLGSVTVGTGGTWSFTTSALSNGTHPLSVTVKDTAGNVSGTTSATITVDTVAPTASTLVITNDATNTVVPSGGSTNDSTPVLSGTAEVGSKVTIYDGSTVLGTLTVGGAGTWSFTTATLSNGTHPLSVTVTDAAGNVSGTTSASVIIDTVAPAAVTGLAASNNNGSTPVAIANNGTTNDNTPALSGTAEAGAKVSIYDGATLLGTVTAGSNGAWSFTTSTLADGLHTLNVTATDAAGNVSPNASVTLTVDTAAPAASTLTITADNVTPNVTVPSGGSTNDNTPTLSGTAEAGSVVTISDGSTVLGSVTVGTGGTWSFTTSALSNGSHPLSVTVKDTAGNVSGTTSATITVDTVAPTASTLVITNDATNTVVPSGGSTNDSTPVLSGTAEVGSKVTIYDGSTVLGTLTVGAGGTWSFTTATLSNGTHPLSVTVTDAAGNVSGTTSASVIIDTVAPAAVTGLAASNNNGSTPVAIANNGTTNDNTPALSGTAEAGAKVSIYDGATLLGTVTAGSNGAWSFTTSTLADGLHTLNVTATDAAGNVSPNASVTLTVDTAAPAASTLTITADNVTPNVTVPSGGSTNDNTPTLSGTAEAGSVVTISDGSTVLGSVTVGTGGTWSFTTSALSNGSHPLSVTVKDTAGNVSGTTSATITVDTVAPAASTLVITNDATNTVVPSGGSTNDSTPVLSGTAEVGSKVTIYDGSTVLGTLTVGGAGTWSFTTATLSNGTHPLSVTVTDAAGNVSGTTSASVIIDTVAPAAVTGLTATNNNGTPVTIPNNGTTNDSTPLLSGTAEAGAKISIYDGATLLGTTTAGSNGAWSFITSTLTEGTHTLNVTATDAAGNVSPNASVTLTVDTVAPTASTLTITNDSVTPNVTVPSGGSTRDTTPVLSGTAEVGSRVTIYDGATILGSVSVGAGGTWSFTTAVLANGSHSLSVTVTDTAGNISGTTSATVIVDTVAPTAATGLAVNTAGTILTGTGEAGTTVTVKDAGGNTIGTGTVASNGSFSVTLTTAQTTGATLSVSLTDAAGNTSPTATVLGAIKIVAANDITEVDYTTSTATVNNGTTSVSHTALATVNLGTLLGLDVLSNGNAYIFNVGNDDTRSVTLNGTVGGISLIASYNLYLYQQTSTGWTLVSVTNNYLSTGLINLGSKTGVNVNYNSLGTGTYAVVIGSTGGVSLLPSTTITTVTDTTVMAVTVAATVTGNLLTNDTSSVAGTVPSGTAVTSVSGHTVGTSTSFSTTYGTLTIDSHGNYTYTLKAGLDIDTLPAADTFTYTVTDAQGVATTATLTVDLVHSTGTASLLAVNSLFAEASTTTDSDSTVSGSIWADSTTSHTGTLTITNEHGDSTTVSSSGSTAVAGDYGTLSIAADGSYTYALSADINVQNITHKEVFSYTLASTDGTLISNSFTIELHPTITGTSTADTLTSSAYDDTITSGAGADSLVYHLLNAADATGGNGHDTWTDFSVANGDKIDVSNLLIGWNDDTSNVNDFVKVDHTADGNTVLSIDRDGTGTAYSSTQLVTVEGTSASLEELLQQPHQNHTA